MYCSKNTETYQETFHRHIDLNDGKHFVLKSGDQRKKYMKLQDKNKFFKLTRGIGML
jgi:hypothetical protein